MTAGWMNGTPQIATPADVTAEWLCGKGGKYFRCALCGYRFQVGDRWRLVYTNSTPGAGGNPLVCKECDGTNEQVIEKWLALRAEANERFWWFTRGEE